MTKFGKAIVKCRIPILILSVALLVPSLLGMLGTRINYDMLNYLPEDMETIIGQDILMEEFGKGGFSMVIVEDMENKEVADLRARMEQVEHVDSVIWYDSIMDLSVPMEMLPDKIYDAFNAGDATMLAVFFETSTSSDDTMEAIREIRALAGKQCFVSGMSAMVTDLKELCEREEPVYVALAVALACAVMMLFMDSWAIPIIFLLSIGMAILTNLGSNYFLGEISYLTKALSAVLQLAVTMDYSIFLWHSYSEQKSVSGGDKKEAMAAAIGATITSVVGSSITTVAGFIALCFMSFTLGKDLGIVMAKGVIFGVIGCVTTLPSMILALDSLIEKTRHRPLMPETDRIAAFLTRHYAVFLIAFLVIIIPAYAGYGKTNQEVYYDLTLTLPEDLDFAVANARLENDFGMGATHMVLTSADLPVREKKEMMQEMEKVEGVHNVLGMESVLGSRIPREFVPGRVTETLESENWELFLINSQYKTATDEMNAQIDVLGGILKKYDAKGMLIGEAPCTKDMIEVTDHDFKVVNTISILAIFMIIAVVLKSISLPFVLVAVIEFAIFINLGLPHYQNVALPFVAPICISTIQLGATVDYAILMTTRYKLERSQGNDRRTSVSTALSTSIPSVMVSALGFFAATFGVGLYSDVDMISALCNLMARGAIISMLAVLFVLPAMFMLLDGVICRTSIGFRSRISCGKGLSYEYFEKI